MMPGIWPTMSYPIENQDPTIKESPILPRCHGHIVEETKAKSLQSISLRHSTPCVWTRCSNFDQLHTIALSAWWPGGLTRPSPFLKHSDRVCKQCERAKIWLINLREPAATRCTRSMTDPAARAAAVGVCTSFHTLPKSSKSHFVPDSFKII